MGKILENGKGFDKVKIWKNLENLYRLLGQNVET